MKTKNDPETVGFDRVAPLAMERQGSFISQDIINAFTFWESPTCSRHASWYFAAVALHVFLVCIAFMINLDARAS